jgi:hypothetical protein
MWQRIRLRCLFKTRIYMRKSLQIVETISSLSHNDGGNACAKMQAVHSAPHPPVVPVNPACIRQEGRSVYEGNKINIHNSYDTNICGGDVPVLSCVQTFKPNEIEHVVTCSSTNNV